MLKPGSRLDVYESGQLKPKFRILIVLVSVMMVILAFRLWYMQIIKGDSFRQRSENNSLRLRKIKPLRGLIMDRNRRIVADNRPSFDVVFIPDKTRDIKKTIEKINGFYSASALEQIESPVIPERMRSFVPIIIERNATMAEIAAVEIHSHELPGVVTEITPVRHYEHGEAIAQTIGVTGEVSRRDIERAADGNLAPGDNVGKFGIEKSLDAHIRGKSGAEQVEVNAAGKIVRSLGKITPTSGNNVILTIDMELQLAAWHAIGGRKGAVVALNPQNGEVLALLSSPSFDPNLFSVELSAATWEKLANDPEHPMENRAVTGQYPPGSTFKPIVAAAALETGTVTPDSAIYCKGVFAFGNRKFHDWKRDGHGEISLHRAIVESCDVYFYNLGTLLDVDVIAKYARGFGFGAPTGIDLPREKSGLVPTRQWKKERFKAPWYAGETVPVSIGQGYNLATPLQLANAYAALANGGIIYRPRIVKQIEAPDGRIVQLFETEKSGVLPVSARNMEVINKGLWGVVNEPGGTGHALKGTQHDVCGKTGTAQVVGARRDAGGRQINVLNAETNDHALFVCFSPCEKPEIAIAVVVENGGHGGTAAAPVARKLVDVYFSQKIRARQNSQKPGALSTGEVRR